MLAKMVYYRPIGKSPSPPTDTDTVIHINETSNASEYRYQVHRTNFNINKIIKPASVQSRSASWKNYFKKTIAPIRQFGNKHHLKIYTYSKLFDRLRTMMINNVDRNKKSNSGLKRTDNSANISSKAHHGNLNQQKSMNVPVTTVYYRPSCKSRSPLADNLSEIINTTFHTAKTDNSYDNHNQVHQMNLIINEKTEPASVQSRIASQKEYFKNTFAPIHVGGKTYLKIHGKLFDRLMTKMTNNDDNKKSNSDQGRKSL